MTSRTTRVTYDPAHSEEAIDAIKATTERWLDEEDLRGNYRGPAEAYPSLETDAYAPSTPTDTKIIMLGGAIKWWWQATCLRCRHWDEADIMERQKCPANGHGRHNLYVWWNSPEHRAFIAWRDEVRAALIDAGYLTYAPWMAFKGTWTERAQIINDAVLSIADAMVVLSPDYAITEGTDVERRSAAAWDVPVIECPPSTGKLPWMRQAVIAGFLDELRETLGTL